MNIKEWHDLSGQPNFLKEGYKTGTKDIIRLAIHDSIEWSEKAVKNRDKLKKKMLEENHTTNSHNMKRAPRDTEHDWKEVTSIPHYKSKVMIDVSESTPWYARSSCYMLSSLLGVSWF
jgi:hypothetical protein